MHLAFKLKHNKTSNPEQWFLTFLVQFLLPNFKFPPYTPRLLLFVTFVIFDDNHLYNTKLEKSLGFGTARGQQGCEMEPPVLSDTEKIG